MNTKCPTCGDDVMVTRLGFAMCLRRCTNTADKPDWMSEHDWLSIVGQRIEVMPYQVREFGKAAKAWHESFEATNDEGGA